MPRASPIHWVGPACGCEKPSAKAQATPANAEHEPGRLRALSRSEREISGMPRATTNGAM